LADGEPATLDHAAVLAWLRRYAAVIEELIDLAPCRVGGGIRDVESAIRWLDRGALSVVLGTAARPEVLEKLPRARVIAALDARHGEVVVEGWQKATGERVLERVAALRELAGGFLVTFVEREGRLQGTDLDFAKEIRAAAGDAAVTIAGGVTTADEVAALDRTGTGDHFQVVVAAPRFSGLSLVEQHRLVYDALAEPLADGTIHELRIKTRGVE